MRGNRWLILAAVLLALGGGVLIGRLTRDGSSAGAGSTPPSTTSPSIAGTPSPSQAGLVPDRPLPRGEAVFRARARSVELRGAARSLRSIRLTGSSRLQVEALVSSSGRSLGEGTLRVEGSTLAVTGPELSLIAPRIVFSASGAPVVDARAPGDETVQAIGPNSMRIALGGGASISGGRMSFSPRDGSSPRALAGTVNVRRPSVALGGFFAELDAQSLRWTDAGASVAAGGNGRSSISWAGFGTVDTASTKPLSGEYVGLVSPDFDATIVRRSGRVEADGRARAVAQVFLGGKPALRTRAGVDLLTPVVEARAGTRATFTWAPRNLGGDYDMCMLRISPASEPARWVNLALERMPAMFGGEPRTPAGGDTRGMARGGTFGSAEPVRAIVPVRDADRREVSFDIPEGLRPGAYSITLVIEGNFAPVRAEIEVRVS